MKNKEKIYAFIHYCIDDMYETDFFGICMQMAFYFLLAFFPMIIFLINFIGQVMASFQGYLFAFLKSFLPDLSYNYVQMVLNQLQNTHFHNQLLLIIITFCFASMAARAIMIGINQNYGNIERRNLFHVWILAFVFTLLFAVSLVLVIVIYVIMNDMTENILIRIGLTRFSVAITQVFTFVFAFVVTILAFDCIYVLAPAKSLTIRQGLPGAIFMTLALNIALRIFVFFVNHSTKYTMLYGNLGGFFALLVGIFFICFIFNFGSKINYYVEIFNIQFSKRNKIQRIE